MTKTKTIPLEVPEDWEFERATIAPGRWYRHLGAGNRRTEVELHSNKPSWHWDYSPTDEMALLRPDCEVRDTGVAEWKRRRLVAVVDKTFVRNMTADASHGYSGWQFCRVRIDDATGKVIVRWGE